MSRTYHAYTTNDDVVIRKMWGKFTTQEIAEEIGVNKKSLEDHARSMEPPLPREIQRGGLKWEPYEDSALLLMTSFDIPTEEIAAALQRGSRGVRQRINHLRRSYGN